MPRLLARYGQVFPASDPCPSESEEEREELQQLLRRRRQRVDQRVQEWNRLDKSISPVVGQSTRRHIAWLDQEIARLDKEYQTLLQRSTALRSQAALYRSVPGVGALTAAMRVTFLPAWGQRDSKALTSLVGLAPWSRDRGHKRGQRSIRGGRAAVRHALYMAALSVIRQTGVHQHFYQGLRLRGKTGKVALVAVMRKLLLHLHAVARRGTPSATGPVPDAASGRLVPQDPTHLRRRLGPHASHPLNWEDPFFHGPGPPPDMQEPPLLDPARLWEFLCYPG